VKDVEEVDGLKLETIKRTKTVLNNGFDLITTQCVYTVTAVGKIPLPKLEASVNGKPVSTNPVVFDVQPNPKYGKAWEIARDFLSSRGVTPNHLVVRYTSDAVAAFSDNEAKAFAVVATTDYASCLENPVLAYGIGNSMWDGANSASDNTVRHIYAQYDTQLKTLKEKGGVYHSIPLSLYMDRPAGVKPLLGDMKYGQTGPYNAYFPKRNYNNRDSTCLVGCGPVALAQVIAFHKHPEKPVGRGSLVLGGGNKTVVQMKDAPFSWDGSKSAVAALMLCSAASVNAKISPTETESSLANFKAALINNWGYSPKCIYMVNDSDMSMLERVYTDLKQGMPVIAADASHIFVIDGYDADFLHLNLGWEGYCDGYYRVIVDPSIKEQQLPFTELLSNIKPLKGDLAYEVSVKVSKTGTLGKELSKLKDGRRMEDITSIKVSGKLNGFDIALLRKLAGGDPNLKPEEMGSLMDIDLSDASLTHGGCYVVRDASKMVFSGTVMNNGAPMPYRYDMAKITNEQWAQMQALGLSQGTTWLVQPKDGGGFIVNWYEETDTIGPYMFADCYNLHSIILPKNIKEVMGNAFSGCRALDSISGLPRKIASDAFDNSSMEGRLY
ncbi:MAG: C10 family peptidase, partial [Bacteroidales bacterium]|nr:C10 family peptidase [Bacteroidales bacterium]